MIERTSDSDLIHKNKLSVSFLLVAGSTCVLSPRGGVVAWIKTTTNLGRRNRARTCPYLLGAPHHAARSIVPFGHSFFLAVGVHRASTTLVNQTLSTYFMVLDNWAYLLLYQLDNIMPLCVACASAIQISFSVAHNIAMA